MLVRNQKYPKKDSVVTPKSLLAGALGVALATAAPAPRGGRATPTGGFAAVFRKDFAMRWERAAAPQLFRKGFARFSGLSGLSGFSGFSGI